MTFIVAENDIVSFLYGEAKLLDGRAYEEWLSLWTDDNEGYWVPCNNSDIDPQTQVSIIFDDAVRLRQRIHRLASGSVVAEQGDPRYCRLVSNIERLDGLGGDLHVAANVIVSRARGDKQDMFIGRATYKLVRTDTGLAIKSKKFALINDDQDLPLIQFIL